MAQRVRIKRRTRGTVQDVEILTSGEKKRVVSLKKRGTSPCKHLLERGWAERLHSEQSPEQSVRRQLLPRTTGERVASQPVLKEGGMQRCRVATQVFL